jgi:hypothetical protein
MNLPFMVFMSTCLVEMEHLEGAIGIQKGVLKAAQGMKDFQREGIEEDITVFQKRLEF